MMFIKFFLYADFDVFPSSVMKTFILLNVFI